MGQARKTNTDPSTWNKPVVKKNVKRVATNGDPRKKEEAGRSRLTKNTKSYAIRRVFYSTVEGVSSHSFIVTLPKATCTNPKTHGKKGEAGRSGLAKKFKAAKSFTH